MSRRIGQRRLEDAIVRALMARRSCRLNSPGRAMAPLVIALEFGIRPGHAWDSRIQAAQLFMRRVARRSPAPVRLNQQGEYYLGPLDYS